MKVRKFRILRLRHHVSMVELGIIGDKFFFFMGCGIIKIHVVSSCN